MKESSSSSKEKFKLTQKLWESHIKEVQTFSYNPKQFPNYNQEWMNFLQKRTKMIISFGGDAFNYNYEAEFGTYWLRRFDEIMRKRWLKKLKLSKKFWKNRRRSTSVSDILFKISETLSNNCHSSSFSDSRASDSDSDSNSLSKGLSEVSKDCTKSKKLKLDYSSSSTNNDSQMDGSVKLKSGLKGYRLGTSSSRSNISLPYRTSDSKSKAEHSTTIRSRSSSASENFPKRKNSKSERRSKRSSRFRSFSRSRSRSRKLRTSKYSRSSSDSRSKSRSTRYSNSSSESREASRTSEKKARSKLREHSRTRKKSKKHSRPPCEAKVTSKSEKHSGSSRRKSHSRSRKYSRSSKFYPSYTLRSESRSVSRQRRSGSRSASREKSRSVCRKKRSRSRSRSISRKRRPQSRSGSRSISRERSRSVSRKKGSILKSISRKRRPQSRSVSRQRTSSPVSPFSPRRSRSTERVPKLESTSVSERCRRSIYGEQSIVTSPSKVETSFYRNSETLDSSFSLEDEKLDQELGTLLKDFDARTSTPSKSETERRSSSLSVVSEEGEKKTQSRFQISLEEIIEEVEAPHELCANVSSSSSPKETTKSQYVVKRGNEFYESVPSLESKGKNLTSSCTEDDDDDADADDYYFKIALGNVRERKSDSLEMGENQVCGNANEGITNACREMSQILINILLQLNPIKRKLGILSPIIDSILKTIKKNVLEGAEPLPSFALDYQIALRLIQDKLRLIHCSNSPRSQCAGNEMKIVKQINCLLDYASNYCREFSSAKTVYGLDIRELAKNTNRQSESEAKTFIKCILIYEGFSNINFQHVDEIYETTLKVRKFSDVS